MHFIFLEIFYEGNTDAMLLQNVLSGISKVVESLLYFLFKIIKLMLNQN